MKIHRGMVALFCAIVMLCVTMDSYAISFYSNRYYFIASSLDKNMVIDVSGGSSKNGTNIQLYQKNNSDAQLFKFVPTGDGYYYIINKGSGKSLDIAGGGTSSGTNVQLYQQNKTSAQKWKLVYSYYNPDKYVSIKAKCGKYLDYAGCETKNGTNIWIYDGNQTAAQAFELIPYVLYEDRVVTLDFNDVESWKREIEAAERSLTVGGALITNLSGNEYYNGNIIVGAKVLETKDVQIRYSMGPGEYYVYKTIQLPKTIRYTLHRHDNSVKVWIDGTALHCWQQCECGYRDEWRWEIPWPDLSDVQTTDKVIEAIEPQWTVLWNVR